MNWPNLKLWKRGSPFAGPEPVPLAVTDRQEIRGAPPGNLPAGEGASPLKPVARARRSWFGWLTGRNRRREAADRLVQGELLLRQVRPVRNDFRDDGRGAGRSGRSKVLYETPPSPERRDDQDHAWNRLRNRRPDSIVVPGD